MNRLKTTLCLVITITLLLFSNCKQTSQTEDSDYSDNALAIDTSPYSVSVADEFSKTYNAEDILSRRHLDHSIFIDLSSLTAALDGGDAISFKNGEIAVMTGVTIRTTENEILIESASGFFIRYELTGTTDLTLTIDSDPDCEICLDEVELTASAGPGLNIASSGKVFLSSAEGTENLISDADEQARIDDLDQKAALYSKSALIIGGAGSLDVNGSYKHGIYSDEYIRITGGALNVHVSARDAIRSVHGFIFDDGALSIVATGTSLDDESRGIKVDGEESYEGAGLGYIVINGGTLDITTVGKAITASFDIEEDGDTASTTFDPNPDVIINNGVITITTTGHAYETPYASCSPEGLEGKDELIVNNGYIVIYTDDDCLNAGTGIEINGGYLYCVSASNDAIDSNGYLLISGGIIVAIGSDAPEGAFDCDQNPFAITGGTFIGLGGTTSTPTASVSTQNSVILSNFNVQQGEIFALTDSSGECLLVCELPASANTMLFSSPDIQDSGIYGMYFSGIGGGDYIFGGMYLDNLYYTIYGTGNSFRILSKVTIIRGY